MKYALISEEQIAQIKLAIDFKLVGDNNKARSILRSLKPSNAVAWAATSEEGLVEALGFNQSNRFDTPLYAIIEVTE